MMRVAIYAPASHRGGSRLAAVDRDRSERIEVPGGVPRGGARDGAGFDHSVCPGSAQVCRSPFHAANEESSPLVDGARLAGGYIKFISDECL